MKYSQVPGRDRRGVIAPFSAILMVFLIGMVAFSVDMGWMVSTQTELQSAADAAALAGAQPLMDGYVLYNVPANTSAQKTTALNNALASARARAKEYALNNGAGGVSGLTLLDSDIEFGFTNASGAYSTTYTDFPNTIRVIVRRDSTANGSLGLFFGPVLGTKTSNLTASAAATIYGGTLDTPGYGLLPMTYDVDDWNNFLRTGKDNDGVGTVDANGLPTLLVYPSIKYKGNFGQLSLDNSHVGASTEIAWVHNGPSKSDIQALIDSNVVPLSNGVNKQDWQGDTGKKASLIMAINEHVGQVYTLPLYKAYKTEPVYLDGDGQGSNYFFNIVGFVGIRIMPSPSNNGMVIVQPAGDIDPLAVFDAAGIAPAGTSSLVTTFAPPKLTQ